MAKCGITNIGGGGGIDPDELTAIAGDVLAGKKAGVAGNDEPVTGTMPNQGAKTSALNCGGSYAIPAGYHNGSGKVTANTLASQTSATATAAQILKSYTAWVNGNKLTGTMIDYSRSPSPIDAIRLANGRFEVAVAQGYHGCSWANNGYEYMSLAQVANVLGITASKIKKGQTICGVAGSMVDYSYLMQGQVAF